jgi:hypothetical protein
MGHQREDGIACAKNEQQARLSEMAKPIRQPVKQPA